MMFTGFDIIIFVILALFTMSGMYKGLIKILVNLLCFIASIVAAIYLFPYIKFTFLGIIDNELASLILGGLISWICSLALFTLIASKVRSLLSGISGGMIDRTLGMVAGLGKGILFSAAIYLVLAVILSGAYLRAQDAQELIQNLDTQKYPEFIADSRTARYLEKLIKKSVILMPEDRLKSIKLPGLGRGRDQDNVDSLKNAVEETASQGEE